MTEDPQARMMLARIDERVKAIADDVGELRQTRKCHTHTEKLRNMEKMLYGLMSVTFGLLGKLVVDAIR